MEVVSRVKSENTLWPVNLLILRVLKFAKLHYFTSKGAGMVLQNLYLYCILLTKAVGSEQYAV